MNYFRILVLGLFIFSGCKQFQEQHFDDRYQIALEEPEEVGVPANEYNKGMLFDFKAPLYKWWVANSKLAIEKVGDTMKVSLRDCGRLYECWGTELDAILDFSKSPVLKVSMRMESMRLAPAVGISLKDMDGYDTNLDRPTQRVRKSDNFVDYYYNFKGKWKQIWPDRRDVNPATISEILFFVNPGQMNWTGTLYIDDIEVITLDEMPSEEELKRRRRAARAKARAAQQQEQQKKEEPKHEPQQTEPAELEEPQGKSQSGEIASRQTEEVPKADEPQGDRLLEDSDILIHRSAKPAVIDNFEGEPKNWFTSNKHKIELERGDNELVVIMKDVGPAFESFGKIFPSVDFTKTPIVKLRFKVEGDQVGELRMDINDIEGFTTNSDPNVKLFELGTDFVDYYYDFTGKFEQAFPNVRRVDPTSIIQILLYVNPGGKPFTGKLVFDEITAISLDDYNNIKK